MLDLLLLIVGFVLLIKGANFFVDGSSGLAKAFGVPGVIIGLTVVALGTSAPELAVSTSAALQNSNEIALSNVVGSNTFNLLCVLGICAMISPVPVDNSILKRDFPFSLFSTIAVLVATGGLLHLNSGLTMNDNAGMVNRVTGAVLILFFIAYIIVLILAAKKQSSDTDMSDLMPIWKCAVLILTGLGMIIAGGQAVVYSAKNIAKSLGMTETLIGLTIVAIGTSLPELVTSIVAARKKETGLAVGNAIGSNIFNLMFILGVSAFIHPVTVNLASVFDMCILIFVTLITYIFCITGKRISRIEGGVMVLLYIADMIFAIMR